MLVIGLGIALLARRAPPVYDAGITRDYGSPATQKIGFHAVERNERGELYRWSRGYAFVQMPYAYRAAPSYLAEVRLRAAGPERPRPLTFRSNERPVAVVTPADGFRVYRLALPPPPDGSSELRLGLQVEPFSPPGDTRPLGVIVTRARLTPAAFVPWPVLLTLALGPLALLALLSARGASMGGALLVAGLLAGALALLAWHAQPAPLRVEWMAWLALAGAGGAALLARETAARLGLALLGALAAFSGAIWPSWLSDDAFISFRYAQNLVAGNGLVYNAGERVEGYTNFLWTMLAALALTLRLDIVVAAYASGVALALALVLATYAAGRHLLGPAWGLAAALLVATSQSLLVYTARGGGLETGLFTLLALLGTAAYLRAAQKDQGPTTADGRGIAGRGQRPGATGADFTATRSSVFSLWSIAGLLLGLATLTRPEGALLMVLTVGHMLISGQGHAKRTIQNVKLLLLPYIALVAPYFLWRYSYYGDLLPNTFYVKAGGGPRVWLRGLEYLGGFVLDFGGPLLILAVAPSLVRLRRLIHEAHAGHEGRGGGIPSPEEASSTPANAAPAHRASLLRALRGSLAAWPGYLLLLCAVYAAYVVSVGGDHFPGQRFLVPLVPWLALLIAGGLAWAYGWLLRYRALHRLAPAALGMLLLAYGGYALGRSEHYDVVLAGNDESLWLWAEIGWWLHDHAAPEESVAAMGAGAIAFYSERPVIDLLGLTEKHIARAPVTEAGAGAAGHEKRDPAYVLSVRRPTYIPRIWDDYFGPPGTLRGQYELITVTSRYGRELELWKRLP